MKIYMIPVTIVLLVVSGFAQETNSVTDSLMDQWDNAWNNEDVPALVSMMQPDAYFASPYQRWFSRDSIRATILSKNLYWFRNSKSIEQFSRVKDDIAWSVGKTTAEYYPDDNSSKAKSWHANYTFVFTKNRNDQWKLQMMIYHEK